MIGIHNIVNVGLSVTPRGIPNFSVNNLAVFVKETPLDSGSGIEPFYVYGSASAAATDFGIGSNTAKAANLIFSQSPNILSGSGQLLVCPMGTIPATSGSFTTGEILDVSGIAGVADGSIDISVDGATAVEISAIDFTGAAVHNLADVVGVLRPLMPAGISLDLNATLDKIIFNSLSSGTLSTVALSAGATGTDLSTMLNVANGVQVVGVASRSETLVEAALRVSQKVYFGGMLEKYGATETEIMDTANFVQTLNCCFFKAKDLLSTVEQGGILNNIKQMSLSHTRCLYHSTMADEFESAYASRAMSVNFSGSATAITMHLKDLIGVEYDDSINDTVLAKLKAAGVDSYVNAVNVPKVFCQGGNQFYDYVYNLNWFVGAIQVAGFNFLATTNTKVPQTEIGMLGLKNAYARVCEQARTNGMIAAGEWTLADTFGDPETFRRMIRERGYYIYSQPIALQASADRDERKAPVAQIAIKMAGALHSTDVLIIVNK